MKFKPVAAAIFTMILALCACSNDYEEFQDKLSSSEVKFSIASVKGFGEVDGAANTRSELQLPRTTDTIDLGEDYMIVAETYNYPEQIFDAPSTRGTPIQTPTQMKDMNIMAFNGGTSDFTSTTPLFGRVKATLVSSNWNNDKAMIWPKVTDKLTFFAVSPAEADDNGVKISEDGRVLTYEAPADVTKQPDICWATPILNRTNPDNSGNHQVNLSMEHRLVSVGLMAMGNYVNIKKVTLSNVFSSGKLNLQTGTWSDIGVKKTFDIGVIKSLESVVIKDITNADGYAMLPEQKFNNDAMLSIVFDDTKTGKKDITKTFRLKLYTGGEWIKGQMILYRMMFKGSYPLTVNPTSLLLPPGAGSAVLNYSTTSPMDITFDTDAAWITGMLLDAPAKGQITIQYSALGKGAPREGNVYVSTGYTTVKVSVKQATPEISVTPNKTPQNPISYHESTFYTYVESSVPWKVKTASGVTVSPSSGGAGKTQVVLRVSENSSYRTNANREVTFTTNTGTPSIDITAQWTTTQKNKYPAGYYSDQVPNYPGLFVRDMWGWGIYESARDSFCPSDGGKVPSRGEGLAMNGAKAYYPCISRLGDGEPFWISESAGSHWLLGERQYTVRGYGGVHWEYRKKPCYIRCVKQMP